MIIKIYKTYEIAEDLWAKITEGFNESFELNVNMGEMKAYYFANILGYAYHALAFTDDGDLMGFNTCSPVIYRNGLKTVLCGSVFVRKKYRKDEFLSSDILNNLRTYCRQEGYKIELGVPNKNAEKFAQVINKSKMIGLLDYYFLPINLSKCFKKTKFSGVDIVVRMFMYAYSFIIGLFSCLFNIKEKHVRFELEKSHEFIEHRLGNAKYHHIVQSNTEFYYRTCDEKGIMVAYIMDFFQNDNRTTKALAKAIWWLLKNEHVDIISFVGWLRLPQCLLFKVPQRLMPKRLPLMYYILDKKDNERFKDISDKRNWNFSLINFDAR